MRVWLAAGGLAGVTTPGTDVNTSLCRLQNATTFLQVKSLPACTSKQPLLWRPTADPQPTPRMQCRRRRCAWPAPSHLGQPQIPEHRPPRRLSPLFNHSTQHTPDQVRPDAVPVLSSSRRGAAVAPHPACRPPLLAAYSMADLARALFNKPIAPAEHKGEQASCRQMRSGSVGAATGPSRQWCRTPWEAFQR